MEKSIFQKYYSEEPFIDVFLTDKERAIDVIIPVLNTNELWEADLYSFYREIPINRLLIGNGGVTDNTLDVLKAFPRVEIIELKGTSLGYRIAKLMQQVTTDFFIYLHSDVYLPSGWFDKMYKYKDEYDWFECYRTLTVLVEINSRNQNKKSVALMTIILFSACFSIVINFILIPVYGAYGAAFATLISFIIVLILTWRYAQKCYYVPINWKPIILLIFSLIIIYYIFEFTFAFNLVTTIILKILTASLILFFIRNHLLKLKNILHISL